MNFDVIAQFLAGLSFRQAVWLFPFAFTLHALEEVWQFTNWARRHASPQFTFRDYLTIHLAGIMTAFVAAALIWFFPNKVVVFLFFTILSKGLSVFRQAYVQVEVFYDPAIIDPAGSRRQSDLADADYQALIRSSLKQRFPAVEGRRETRELMRLVSSGASFDLRQRVLDDPVLVGKTEKVWLLASDETDLMLKGKVSRGGAEW